MFGQTLELAVGAGVEVITLARACGSIVDAVVLT